MRKLVRAGLGPLAVVAALAMPVLAGCDSTVGDGARDTTVGEAVSGTAVPQVTDDIGAALSPTPTVVAGLTPTPALERADSLEAGISPTPTVVGTLSPTPALEPADDLEVAPSPTRTVEAMNGHYASACDPGVHAGLDGWFWDNAVRWEGDGSTILFSLGPVVYAAEADGSDVRTVADASTTVKSGFASTAGQMTSFDVTPEGDQIVYATCAYEKHGLSERERNSAPSHVSRYGYELAVVGVDGTQLRRLTANRAFDNYPSWSPDGTRIAFLTGHMGRSGSVLHTIAADGSDEQSISIGRAVVLHPPQWSPDGTRVAVVGGEDMGWKLAIYTMRADGSDLRRLGAAVSGPAWSPDGSRIAFATDEGDEIALYTMASDGTDARKVPIESRWAPRYGGAHGVLVEYEIDWITTLEWSPGGDRLLYTCGSRVCVVDLDGTLVGESPIELASGSVAAWSPDGTRIAVGLGAIWPAEDMERKQRDGEVALYSMAPDGSDMRILAAYTANGAARPAGVSGCTVGVAVPDPDRNAGLVGDCQTLLAIRDVLAGTAVLDWSGDRPISEWSGVVVGGSPRRVLGLNLRKRGLGGRIPPELSNLTQLEELDLNDNRLGGGIPFELSSLKNLQRLDLSSNLLSGGIPPEPGGLGDLNKLEQLNRHEDRQGGPIPTALGRLKNLRSLSLADNRLTGAIPAELGQLRELTNLDLSHNDLTGEIPAELGRLGKLTRLSLKANYLDGEIPAELSELTNLKHLEVVSNRFTGCIPEGLSEIDSHDLDELVLPDCE